MSYTDNNKNIRIIAYYLPQYHPTIDNDKWWGKGFTEWTNVAKAIPLFKGHYQPKIPADLGFYDLRLPEVREAQTILAKEAGIEGFCYYHYWFGDEKQELELPFKEIVRLGKPDFPFCLCWANESWYAKTWDKDSKVSKKKLLVEQRYLGTEDNIKHFNTLLPAFNDRRYIRIDDKPIFIIYKPLEFIGIKQFIAEWNDLAIKNGLKGIFFIGYSLEAEEEASTIFSIGFDAVNSCKLSRILNPRNKIIRTIRKIIRRSLFHIFKNPIKFKYENAMKHFVGPSENDPNVIPTIIPNWDHTPRSKVNGYLFTDSTPKLFQKHVNSVLEVIQSKPAKNRISFLKSWNEWGEGNYMEPDLKFGKQYIEALRKEVDMFQKNSNL